MVCWENVINENEEKIRNEFRKVFENDAYKLDKSFHIDIYINKKGELSHSDPLSEGWYLPLNDYLEIEIGAVYGWNLSEYDEFDVVENVLNNEYDYSSIQKEFIEEAETDDLIEADFERWLKTHHADTFKEYVESFKDWLFSEVLPDSLDSWFENALITAKNIDKKHIEEDIY